MTGRFGTSETFVFGTQGPIKAGTATNEVCTTCEYSSNGPHKFTIHREDQRSATLICPNCGETKTVFPSEVQRVEVEQHSKLQRNADEDRAATEEAAQLATLVKSVPAPTAKKKASTKKKASAKKTSVHQSQKPRVQKHRLPKP